MLDVALYAICIDLSLLAIGIYIDPYFRKRLLNSSTVTTILNMTTIKQIEGLYGTNSAPELANIFGKGCRSRQIKGKMCCSTGDFWMIFIVWNGTDLGIGSISH
jgi:hypothetical protein